MRVYFCLAAALSAFFLLCGCGSGRVALPAKPVSGFVVGEVYPQGSSQALNGLVKYGLSNDTATALIFRAHPKAESVIYPVAELDSFKIDHKMYAVMRDVQAYGCSGKEPTYYDLLVCEPLHRGSVSLYRGLLRCQGYYDDSFMRQMQQHQMHMHHQHMTNQAAQSAPSFGPNPAEPQPMSVSNASTFLMKCHDTGEIVPLVAWKKWFWKHEGYKSFEDCPEISRRLQDKDDETYGRFDKEDMVRLVRDYSLCLKRK